MKKPQRRWPAEWEPCGAVLLAWPRAEGDWAPYLDEVRPTMAGVVAAIARRAPVLLLTDDRETTASALPAAVAQAVTLIDAVPYDDTWIRDFGPLSVLEAGRPRYLDFGFNGWGLKFAAADDNRVSRALHRLGLLGAAPLTTPGLVLEGGSVESDGAGTVLTTTACLLSDNRNPHLDRAGVETALARELGADRVLWLDHGHLAGDDTDAHVDTLARLCPDGVIAHVGATEADADHAPGLRGLAEDLRALRQADGTPYRLVELPMAPAMHAPDDGRRLPATYANFLFVNGTVLVPTYGDPACDRRALAAVAAACPGWTVEGVDCHSLVLQHGSLHCSCMQIPSEVWSWRP